MVNACHSVVKVFNDVNVMMFSVFSVRLRRVNVSDLYAVRDICSADDDDEDGV